MFSKIKPSIFPIATTAIFLSLYTSYFPRVVNLTFLILGGVLTLLGIVAFARSPKQFLGSLSRTEEMFGMTFLPLTFMMITYRLSQSSFLIKPYQPFFIVFSLLTLVWIALSLIVGGASGIQPQFLYPAYALSSLPALIIYLLPVFGVSFLESLMLTLYLVVNFFFLFPSLFSLFLKNKVFVYNKAYLCYFFPTSLLLLMRFVSLQDQEAFFFVLALVLTLANVLVFLLFMFEKSSQAEFKKANLSAFFAQSLWTYVLLKNNLIAQVWFVDMQQSVFKYLPQFMLALEYILLFLCFMVFTKTLSDQLFPAPSKRGKV